MNRWMATKSNQDYEKYKVSIKGMALITNHLLFANISVNWGGGGGGRGRQPLSETQIVKKKENAECSET